MKKTPIAAIVRWTAGAACLALVLWSLPGCGGNEDGHDEAEHSHSSADKPGHIRDDLNARAVDASGLRDMRRVGARSARNHGEHEHGGEQNGLALMWAAHRRSYRGGSTRQVRRNIS